MRGKECAELLWREVWRGGLSADAFEPVRRGLESGFIPRDMDEHNAAIANASYTPGRRLPKALRNRWRSGPPVRGGWFSLVPDDLPDGDPLDEECLNRDRVRLLLARYGVLCRPLLERERMPFSWSGLLPAIRRMELAGELVAGRFFAGVPSLQFASPAIIGELERAEACAGIYWMNAADPASPAGLALEGLPPHLCARIPGSRLYFRGAELIAVSNKNGKELRMYIKPDDSGMGVLASLCTVPRTRKVMPENKVLIETINGAGAAHSEYAEAFRAAGFISDRGKLYYW
jgi:ATP-dependent Lhr-like helicase